MSKKVITETFIEYLNQNSKIFILQAMEELNCKFWNIRSVKYLF